VYFCCVRRITVQIIKIMRKHNNTDRHWQFTIAFFDRKDRKRHAAASAVRRLFRVSSLCDLVTYRKIPKSTAKMNAQKEPGIRNLPVRIPLRSTNIFVDRTRRLANGGRWRGATATSTAEKRRRRRQWQDKYRNSAGDRTYHLA